MSLTQQTQAPNVDDPNEILLSIPQANIQIYPKKIVVYNSQPRSPVSFNQMGKNCKNGVRVYNIQKYGVPSFDDLEQTQVSQIILLTDKQIAFQILEDINCVRLINVIQQQQILKFQVEKKVTLKIIEGLLKGKLPQIGFTKTFRLLQKIGSGRTADVYLAERIIDHKNFAIKEISMEDTNNARYKIFMNEVQALTKLNHPNIIKLQSFYYHEKNFYLVCEYLDGGTLQNELIYNFPETEGHILTILYDLIKGIQYLRQKGIVHRDIKPQNILIRKKQNGVHEYVICDFGISSYINQQKHIFILCGSYGYMAPQVFDFTKENIQITHKLDIFSYGVVAYTIAFGERPFKFTDTASLIQSNKKCQINFDSPYASKYPKIFCDFLKNSLSVDKNKRYSSDQILSLLGGLFEKAQKTYKIECQKQTLIFQQTGQQFKEIKKSANFYTLLRKEQENRILKNSEKRSIRKQIKYKDSQKATKREKNIQQNTEFIKQQNLNKESFTQKKLQTNDVSAHFKKQSLKKSLEKVKKSYHHTQQIPASPRQPSIHEEKNVSTFIKSLWRKISGQKKKQNRPISQPKSKKHDSIKA